MSVWRTDGRGFEPRAVPMRGRASAGGVAHRRRDRRADRLARYGLHAGEFHLLAARFEPDHRVDLLVDGFLRSRSMARLAVVGSAPYADAYGARVYALAGDDPRVTFLGAVWDDALLEQLYAGCVTYLEGRSEGAHGLRRAMAAGACCIAYDTPANREVLGGRGSYVRGADDVARALESATPPLGSHLIGAPRPEFRSFRRQ
jgi:glycosyltransferase involved in cell wall biosynthesis